MSVLMILRIALKALGRNKMRTALTMLGMIIGVAAVITMVALGTGAQSSIEAQIQSAGTNVIIISTGNFMAGGVHQGQGAASTLVPDDAANVAQVPGVQYVAAGMNTRGQLIAGNQNWNTQVQGTGTDLVAIRSWPMQFGGFFTDDDVRLLQIVADRVALATQSRRAEIERTAAVVLQRSLLPAQLPVLPGLELAARYIPAENGGVSGDWYDVFTLPSGWLCIVIGDVVGRGLGAADVMGRLRSALRAYALLGGDPAEVLGRLDQQVQHFEPDTMVTVLLAMFEPSFERLHLSSAGHPPPVRALPHQPAALLDVPSDHPVGVRGGRRRRATTITLPPGALLCFYTDGLVERRDIPLDAGLERLCRSIVAGSVDAVCENLMTQLVGDNSPHDDVAVLAVRRQDSGEIGPLDLVVPALPWSLRDIRGAVRRWLSAVGAAPRTVADLLIVVGEACTNAIEHGYGPGGGTVTVHLELQLPDVLATVSDTGRWRPPSGEGRGRGTLFMRNCCDDLRIDHGPTGTNVVIRHRLTEEEVIYDRREG